MPAHASAPAVPSSAHRQGGVFTAAQARAEGFRDRTIRYRIAERRWVYVAGRALAEPAMQWTAFQLAIAASLSIAGSVISHTTAAALHGFPLPRLGSECRSARSSSGSIAIPSAPFACTCCG